jgi:hypothetical protein
MLFPRGHELAILGLPVLAIALVVIDLSRGVQPTMPFLMTEADAINAGYKRATTAFLCAR